MTTYSFVCDDCRVQHSSACGYAVELVNIETVDAFLQAHLNHNLRLLSDNGDDDALFDYAKFEVMEDA